MPFEGQSRAHPAPSSRNNFSTISDGTYAKADITLSWGISPGSAVIQKPGDVRASAVTATDGPRGTVLTTLPEPAGYRLRIAFGEQILHADAAQPLPVGSTASLSLSRPGRLLPWHSSTPSIDA